MCVNLHATGLCDGPDNIAVGVKDSRVGFRGGILMMPGIASS